MDGIINIIKPAGMTSFDVVAYIRRVLGVKKAGHTGTLDPGASGLITVCLGRATKVTGYLASSEKVYVAGMRLGQTTDTLDSCGNVLADSLFEYDRRKLDAVIASFTGPIWQVPPMYSAVKVNGQRLYKLARKGIEVKREAREVFIDRIEVVDDEDRSEILLRIYCSKGTYIRSLIADIGEKYGCGAHMGVLVRIRSGRFDISDAFTLEEVARAAAAGNADKLIVHIEEVFTGYEKLILNDSELTAFMNGAYIYYDKKTKDTVHEHEYAIYNVGREFLGLGVIVEKEGQVYLKAKKLL